MMSRRTVQAAGITLSSPVRHQARLMFQGARSGQGEGEEAGGGETQERGAVLRRNALSAQANAVDTRCPNRHCERGEANQRSCRLWDSRERRATKRGNT